MSTPIELNDIKVGDTIKASSTYKGLDTTYKGTVAGVADSGLYVEEGGYLYHSGWVGDWRFELLDRPKPAPPADPGSVILASKIQGWIVNPRGTYLSLSVTGVWNSLDSNLRGVRAELIEEWVSVSLVPNQNVSVEES